MRCLPDRAKQAWRRDYMRWFKSALSAASVTGVLLVAIAMLLFTPAAAIAGQSDSTWRPQPNDPAALSRTYDVTRHAMQVAGAPYAQWVGQGRQFLTFDPRGTGRIVEVFGDLLAADRIAALVPGAAHRAEEFNAGLGELGARGRAVQAVHQYD